MSTKKEEEEEEGEEEEREEAKVRSGDEQSSHRRGAKRAQEPVSLDASKAVRENHYRPVCDVAACPREGATNLVATVGSNQLNVYDNDHLGRGHLALMSVYLHRRAEDRGRPPPKTSRETAGETDTDLLCVAWVRGGDNDEWAVCGARDGGVVVVSLAGSAVLREMRAGDGPVTHAAALEPPLVATLTRGANGAVRVWNAATGELVAEHAAAGATCMAAWGGGRVAVGRADGSVVSLATAAHGGGGGGGGGEEQLYAPPSGAASASATAPVLDVTAAGEPPLLVMLCASASAQLRVYDTAAGRMLRAASVPDRTPDTPACRVGVSADGRVAALGGGTGCFAYLYELAGAGDGEWREAAELFTRHSRKLALACALPRSGGGVLLATEDSLLWRCERDEDDGDPLPPKRARGG